MTSHVSRSWRKTATFVATLVAAGSLLSACSLFSGPWTRDGEERKAEKAEKEPIGLPPIATHRFEYDPAKDDVVGVMQKTIVGEDDTLPDIARRFNLGYEEIVRANPGVDPWLPGAGREVVLPTRFILPSAPHEGVVINIPAMRLFYFPKRKENEPHVVITYPIGIGKVGWATPEGSTRIVRRTKDPTWTVPVSVRDEHRKNGEELPPIVPPGPDNPLGRHSFTLGWPSYLVHGTNKPYGVGMRSSHGCIRLYPEDIEQLFETVPIGTRLRVVNQPYLLGRLGDDLLLQAYDVLEDDKRDWEKSHRKLFDKSLSVSVKKTLQDRKVTLDWERFEALVREPRAIPVSMLLPEASMDAEIVGARLVQNTVPEGSNWDGQVVIDEEKFQELLSDRDPGAPGTPATTSTPGSSPPPAQQSAPEGGSP